MLLLPKRTKFRKRQKGHPRGVSLRGSTIAFGEYGLQVLEVGSLTNRQIESARVAINRHAKRVGKLWIRIFPDTPYTSKPAEVRMGKGKGNVEGWVAVVRKGVILFEMAGVDEDTAQEAMRLAASKLPLRTRFISSEERL